MTTMMSLLVTIFLVGLFCDANAGVVRSKPRHIGFKVPIPRDQTEEQYFRSVRNFWTRERLASAIPMELSINTDRQLHVPTLPQNGEYAAERVLTPSAPKVGKSNPGPVTAGKIFFVMNGLRYMCSGSVVNANNRDTIVTAGHCTYNSTSGEESKQLVFIPFYLRGERPYGTFPARFIAPTEAWTNGVDYNNDVAVVLVGVNEDGEHVQDVTGGLGITVNPAAAGSTNLFGYPAIKESGEVMDTCSGQTAKASFILSALLGFNGIGITCHMNGGSSGGPWLRSYNSQTGAGVQISVTSFGSSLAAGKIQGPLFTEENIGYLYDWLQWE